VSILIVQYAVCVNVGKELCVIIGDSVAIEDNVIEASVDAVADS